VRTVSVKEVAAALGVTTRAVIYRLEKGDLKGVRSPNPYGVQEWRIYPNKEVLEKLKAPGGSLPQASPQELNFEPADVVDAVTTEAGPEEVVDEGSMDSGTSGGMPEAFRAMVQECVRPLVERLEVQALALSEKDKIIEEQSRQLRLLPDFEKLQRETELKTYESEALKKQLLAVEEEKQRIEQERLDAEEAATEAQSKLQSTEALKAEIQEQLQWLRSELDRVKQPWWKRWFSAQDGTV